MVVTFVLEAGLPTPILEAEVRAMADAARNEPASLLPAATPKVVEHGKADGMYITTTGIGRPFAGRRIDPHRCVLATRFCSPARSAITASPFCWHAGNWKWKPRSGPTRARYCRWSRLCREAGPGIRWMRDPTRGGVATSLNELARDCGLGIASLRKMPVRDAVRGACELLGLDPLHIANEGQFLAVVSPEYGGSCAARAATQRRAEKKRG